MKKILYRQKKREYRTQYIEHSYIEPEAALAFPDPNSGTMTVYASAQILGVPLNRVRMIQAVLGESFVMGQGYGITEDVAPNKGRVKNWNFDSYILPTAMDAPKMQVKRE